MRRRFCQRAAAVSRHLRKSDRRSLLRGSATPPCCASNRYILLKCIHVHLCCSRRPRRAPLQPTHHISKPTRVFVGGAFQPREPTPHATAANRHHTSTNTTNSRPPYACAEFPDTPPPRCANNRYILLKCIRVHLCCSRRPRRAPSQRAPTVADNKTKPLFCGRGFPAPRNQPTRNRSKQTPHLHHARRRLTTTSRRLQKATGGRFYEEAQLHRAARATDTFY